MPLGELLKSEVREIARASRPRRRGEKGQHRHLLHRRAAVRRVPAPIPPRRARRHSRRFGYRARPASRPRLLHARPASRSPHRRRCGSSRGRLVRRREERGAQRAHRRAGARASPVARASSLVATGMHWIGSPPHDVERRASRCAATRRFAIANPTRPAPSYRPVRARSRCSSTNRSARRRRASSSCSTTATAAWAARRSTRRRQLRRPLARCGLVRRCTRFRAVRAYNCGVLTEFSEVPMTDSFGARKSLTVRSTNYQIYRLDAVKGADRYPAVYAEDPAREPAALRGRREHHGGRHHRARELGPEGRAGPRDLVHAGARRAAGLHGRARRRRPGRDARRGRQARRQSAR